MVREGRAYRLRIGYSEILPQRILVESLRRQRLGEMTEADAAREGSANLAAFRAEWEGIYGGWDPSEEIWVVEFSLLPT